MIENYSFIYYLIFGYLSNYDLYHLSSMGIIYYFFYNIINYINGDYIIDKFKVDLIRSYITKNQKIEPLDNSINIIDNFLINKK